MNPLSTLTGNTDIYLLDQIMKGRYHPGERILDAGAGAGRNLHYFVHQGFEVYAADRNPEALSVLKSCYPDLPAERIVAAEVDALPFPDGFFQHVISSAVLHFAASHAHFERMFAEMVRVLKPGGTLFIRMTTTAGMGNNLQDLGLGRYHLPDGSDRYLLSRPALDRLLKQHRLTLLEPFKTVLVDEVRSMAVVMVGKEIAEGYR
ncbi:MAG: class I SAM-dependent methyltransferase [Saprospiraceae bacterium]|nr:class I SAM-dependent methyltransferase [Saprospiraceae bacterium]